MPTQPVRTQAGRNRAAKHSICRAALELVAINGYERTTLAEIGLRAGFSRGIVSYHFGTKGELAAHLVQEFAKSTTFLDDLRIDEATTGEKALACLERHLEDSWANFDAMGKHGGLSLADRGMLLLSTTARFSGDPVLREAVDPFASRLHKSVSAVIARCVRDGTMRADVDPEATALFYVYSIWGLFQALVTDPEQHALIARSVDTLRAYILSLRPAQART